MTERRAMMMLDALDTLDSTPEHRAVYVHSDSPK